MPAAIPSAQAWRGRRVLVTGHTGFVGGWLCTWLARLGARVTGLALPPPTTPSFFELARVASFLERSIVADVRDPAAISGTLRSCEPQVVFHLAAQPLVREAYRDPVTTFATNVMGTVNVLEACRGAGSLEGLVVYTTDKVYRNAERGRPFVEGDGIGGNEPYSASKAAADAAVAAFWASYLAARSAPPAVATVRAGNILGGGDWGRDRLLPDAVSAFAGHRQLVIRNPGSVRPWQHVLDVVRGTLLLAERRAVAHCADDLAWNLGPPAREARTVAAVATHAADAWGEGARWREEPDASIPESRALLLSSDKAREALGWECAWDTQKAVSTAIAWYRSALGAGADPLELTHRQIEAHVADVEGMGA